ncbi:MAG TPA: DUF362 domain-containing protein [candidate division Zixibacteria bacterium]|nr:DUF362 domain-containing protein [candidate division Zixibacteria bacterium]
MRSKVYFIPWRGNHEEMAGRLAEHLALNKPPFLNSQAKIGIKVHWGEPGNVTFLPADYARAVAQTVLKGGAKAFIFDTTTLYRGERRDPVDNLFTAHKHGFDYSGTGAPAVVADGMMGLDIVEISVPGEPKRQKKVKVSSVVDYANGVITVSHFKGHLASGFGGVIKNISMGMASRATKQVMHAEVKPEFKASKCNSCGICGEHCPVDAIKMDCDYPSIDMELCIGCAECIAICPSGAYRILWNSTPEAFLEKLVETAAAVNSRMAGRMMHVQILASIAPECDCMGHKMEPLVDDIGILIGDDVLAVDVAACDLFNRVKPLESAEIEGGKGDYIIQLYPDVPYRHQFEYAEFLGLGSMDYELIEIQ